MRLLGKIILTGVMLGSVISMAWAGSASPLFDKPLHETHTPLPLDPDNPQSKPMLSCFYYPDFMVKQVDLGEKGAEQLSILPAVKDHAEPPCLRANAKDEMVIDPKVWSGYFEGVKGDFVFFIADDGINNGMGFAVYSSISGKRIFDDVAKFDNGEKIFSALAAQTNPKNNSSTVIKLSYQRVYAAHCSLRANTQNCWKAIQQATSLKNTEPPNCAAAYEAEKKRTPKWANKVDSYESVITYDVEVVLNSKEATVSVLPVSKSMECYLAD